MGHHPKILAFAGSLRKDSFNKKLVKIAMNGAEHAGAEVTYIDLKDFPLPTLDQDIEAQEGLPENALKLKELMLNHDGFLIASPEYNSSLSAALKNMIDWTSRQASPQEPNLSCFVGKVAAIMSASPGNLGGIRGLVHLRSMLENISVMVIPEQKCISQATDAFDDQGNLKSAKDQKAIEHLGSALTELIKKLKT